MMHTRVEMKLLSFSPFSTLRKRRGRRALAQLSVRKGPIAGWKLTPVVDILADCRGCGRNPFDKTDCGVPMLGRTPRKYADN